MARIHEKTETIVIAAQSMFARYGYGKTTMADIAAEAQIARQTVYNAFPNKEAVLRAVVRHTAQETLRAVQALWVKTPDLEKNLKDFHLLGPVAWFDAVRASPDWATLIEGMNNAACEEMEQMDRAWRAALIALIEQRGATFSIPINDVVDFFYSASLHAKRGVQTREALKKRLETIRAATLAMRIS